MLLQFSVSVLAFLVVVLAVKIPPQLNLKRCNYGDAKLEECLRAALEDAIPKLKNGSPELGIPVLEPVEITEIALETDRNAPIFLNIKLKNLNLWGAASDVTIQNLRWDKKNLIIAVNVTNDRILLKGNYESNGKLLAFPVEGGGPIKVEMTDAKTQIGMEFKPIVRKGLQYWDLVKMDDEVVKIGNMTMRLEGLIKGNQALNDNLNRILNENWEELDRQMRPVFSKALRLYFFGVTQRFFRRVPVSDIWDGFDQS